MLFFWGMLHPLQRFRLISDVSHVSENKPFPLRGSSGMYPIGSMACFGDLCTVWSWSPELIPGCLTAWTAFGSFWSITCLTSSWRTELFNYWAILYSSFCNLDFICSISVDVKRSFVHLFHQSPLSNYHAFFCQCWEMSSDSVSRYT